MRYSESRMTRSQRRVEINTKNKNISFGQKLKQLFTRCRPKSITKTSEISKNSKFRKKIWEPFRDDTVTFCNTTSVGGLRHVVADGVHILERVCWFVIIMILIYSLINFGTTQITRYAINPTVVTIRKDFRQWVTKFPAITICLEEKVDNAKARDFIKSKWNVTENDEKYLYYQDFVKLVTSISFRTNVRQFWRFENDPAFQGLELMSVVVGVSQTLTARVTLHDRQHRVEWDPIMTEMGMCHTFNSIFSKYQGATLWEKIQKTNDTISTNAIEKPLLTCRYTSKQCYARFSIINGTGKYYVHSPYEIAEITSNPTDIIEEGDELDIEFRTSSMNAGREVRPLNIRQRSCKYPDEPISKSIPAYSNALCQMECRNRMAIIFCGCRPYFSIFGDGKICSLEGMCCIARNMEVLINLPSNLAKCFCVPQCTEINYMPYTKKLTHWNSNSSSLFSRKASAKFSLQVPKVMMHKDLIFTFTDLIASFGGTGALFLGISSISLVEICVYLVNFFVRIIKLVSYRKKKESK